MIVIIEGVDGSGKSTLCKKLVDLGYDQAIITGGNTEFERYKNLKNSYKSSVVIMDRSFITDIVYRSIDCKQRRGMNLYEIMKICDEGVKIVHCTSDTCFTDSMTRGEDNVTTEAKSLAIRVTYHTIMNMFKTFSNVKVMNYDWHINNIDDVIKFIEGGKDAV